MKLSRGESGIQDIFNWVYSSEAKIILDCPRMEPVQSSPWDAAPLNELARENRQRYREVWGQKELPNWRRVRWRSMVAALIPSIHRSEDKKTGHHSRRPKNDGQRFWPVNKSSPADRRTSRRLILSCRLMIIWAGRTNFRCKLKVAWFYPSTDLFVN